MRRVTRLPTRWRRVLVAVGGLVLGALALWLAARGVDGDRLVRAFGGVEWAWVAAGGIASMVTIVCQAAAWQLGLRHGGCGEVPLRHVVGASWIARAANQVLPGKLGEVARVMIIRRHVPSDAGQVSRIVGSLVAQRILAGLATFLVVTSAALMLPLPHEIPGGRLAPVGAIVAALVLAFGLRRVRFGPRARRVVPARLRAFVAALVEGAGLLAHRRTAVAAVGFHMAGLLAQVGTVALLLRAFGVQAPAEASLLVLALMAIAGAVSAAPGGVGVTQFAIVAPLGAIYGVGADLALAFSLGLQATIAAAALVGGLAALVHQRLAMPHRTDALAGPLPAAS